MSTISEKIKDLRKAKGLRQSEIANEIKVSRTAYVQVENGTTKNISLDMAIGIAKVLGVSFNELFEIENPELEKTKKELEETKSLYNKQLAIEKDLKELLNFVRKEANNWFDRLNLVDRFYYIDNELFKQHYKAIVSDNTTFEVYPTQVINSFWQLHTENSNEEILKYFDLNKFNRSPLAQKAKSGKKDFFRSKHSDESISTEMVDYEANYKKMIESIIEAKKRLPK